MCFSIIVTILLLLLSAFIWFVYAAWNYNRRVFKKLDRAAMSPCLEDVRSFKVTIYAMSEIFTLKYDTVVDRKSTPEEGMHMVMNAIGYVQDLYVMDSSNTPVYIKTNTIQKVRIEELKGG